MAPRLSESNEIVIMNPANRLLLAVGIAVCCEIGCVSSNPRYDNFQSSDLQDSEVTVAYGRPHRFADGLASLVGLPERVLTLHPNVNNHQFSDSTRRHLLSYLEKNDLTDVYVRVNQYDPVGEWRRLRDNERIAPGWKYTVGLLPLTMYTLVPGRIFGGDQYNPFTNSLSINSDISAVALHEAAYARDVRNRSLPGTYVAINELPFLSLWRHAQGIKDVVKYAQQQGDWPTECETYRVVYPMIGMHIASGGFHAVLGNEPLEGMFLTPLLPIGGAIAGHAAGEMAVSRRRHELGLDAADEESSSSIQLASWRQKP